MADEPTGRDKARDDAKKAARVVLAKHTTVIPSPCPEPPAKPASTWPFDIGVRNILRSLSR